MQMNRLNPENPPRVWRCFPHFPGCQGKAGCWGKHDLGVMAGREVREVTPPQLFHVPLQHGKWVPDALGSK